ncbi:homeodomain transcription factor ste12 [Coccidioides posadasii str. Silveira]|uniref:Transcription factor steA n=3 Tax=Coccidioides posadasii TaxID=199306 RepID=E9DB43_COCPS|nr:Transcription factor SteA, putative [Coccidioides posadasii C735 delta SOWgp]EER27285.1 Transcription factor SteA, putative [Coccidioides posadasii C735 delta SOWgp]EFW16529.1 transcription factor steA [Coccidioides posadasii str. Silveira]KMM67055.1 transcription factor steA [Coccidioides posadasii RMSCC 3488]QVM11194.1 homeodomain transcription factor ste12 [Coccidioides posadasii str. Silveira]|eukprot:XP_003069430.1 Transcription factor SteA, putative [Coccidioides posadasii C735 delta SOWgp]
MYSQHGASMAPPQKPETFMLSNEAQQSLPQDAQVALQQVDNLKYFLISAPVDWAPDQLIRRFLLPTGDYVSCVLWNNLFHISGTDIVRCLSFRFQAFGRPVKNTKKFEEGIFSDLRNLKAGTDASLEEPKSPFLDFLYKNNCIRTQKKQKVFYWYSVPHDRLFLDALERDLKREKMGQEATTVAVNEPALSFQFDSSQSLYEQLTKAQQANSSSFSAHASTAYHSASPMIRTTDSMPPPQLPPAMPIVPEETHDQGIYNSVGLTSATTTMGTGGIKAEQDFGQVQYDRNGVPVPRIHQRHTSMPTYMEYSPAPSFVSSHYDDYGHRGISFEPITPPQHNVQLGSEPAYIANEDTGLYTAIPDIGTTAAFNAMMQLPPSNFAAPQFSTASRTFPSTNVYSVIEGSPTYKQRRRRSSIPPGITNAIAAATGNGQTHSNPHAAHRPSDLHHSISVQDGDESNQESPPGLTHSYKAEETQKMHSHENSRLGTPLPTLDETQADDHLSLINPQPEMPMLTSGEALESSGSSNSRSNVPGPVRRARSATMMELGPYPQKSHSCPIPSCGRLFKRLEHLKRHVRTHTQERPYPCPYCNRAFSRSDNLAQHRRTHGAQAGQQPSANSNEEDREQQEPEHEATDQEHTTSDTSYLPTTVNMASVSMPSMSIPNLPSMVAPQMISPQLLQQQI